MKSTVILKVCGKNINNFIRKVNKNNINLLSIKYINDYIIITIYKSDYDKILELKTIYDINIIDYKGLYKFKLNILKNKVLLINSLFFIVVLYIFSHIIFSINIITNDNKMKEKLYKELETLGIKKYNFVRDYKEIQIIKNKIIEKYRDEIEWIEISRMGTKYIVKYEPRILNNNKTNYTYRNIIAKKDAIITKLNIREGEIQKGINTYVKKGEVIVSGIIYLNENIKDIKQTSGIVYGEVWYKVYIKYPLKYYECIETGKENKIVSINFLSKQLNLFSHYKTKNITDDLIVKDNIVPINISISTEKETRVIDENNTTETAIERALEVAKQKIITDDNELKDYKIISKKEGKEYVELEIFFTVIENITDYEEIQDNY